MRSDSTAHERLLAKFERTPWCWPWRAYIEAQGYGIVRVGDKSRKAHRVVYELLVGPIPDGKVLHHKCENRRCVNPAHLVPMEDAEHKRLSRQPPSARDACPNGHPYTAESQFRPTPGDPRRRCRVCFEAKKERSRQAQARKRQEELAA